MEEATVINIQVEVTQAAASPVAIHREVIHMEVEVILMEADTVRRWTE